MSNTSTIHTRIAIVEDEPTIIDSLEMYTRYEKDLKLVGKYEDAQTAIDLIPYDRPDVVIMDIKLGGSMDGLDCMLKILQQDYVPKFLMYTASDADRKLMDAIGMGAKGYVLKSEDVSIIPRHVRKIANGDSVISDRMLNILFKILEREKTQRPEVFKELEDLDMRIVKLTAEGKSDKEIAGIVGKNHDNVRNKQYHIRKKLNTESRYTLIVMYWKEFGGPI